MLVGMKWTDESLSEKLASTLVEELEVGPSAPGVMSAYRNALMPR